MTPVETVPGFRGRGLGESSGGENSSMIYWYIVKNLCKYYNAHSYPSKLFSFTWTTVSLWP
jgi:hypothetical protein